MAAKMQKTKPITFLVEVQTPATAKAVLRAVREGAWDQSIFVEKTGQWEPLTVVQISANVIRPTRPRPNARPVPVPAKRTPRRKVRK